MQITKQVYKNFTWIDVMNPEKIELDKLLAENSLPIKLSDDILSPTLRAKVEKHTDALYVTLHFPVKSDNVFQNVEIDFLIKESLIFTSHYRQVDFLFKFIEEIKDFKIEEKSIGLVHGAAYFSYFMRNMYKNIENNLDDIVESINKIEESIFTENERKTIEEISVSRHKLFDFESTMRFHKEVLESYTSSSLDLFGRDLGVYSQSMINDYFKIWHTIEHQKNMLLDLKDTNDFLLSHKTNQMIKSFTALSFVILPLTLLSGFFGMNTIFPETLVKNPYGTVQIAIGMLCIAICVMLYLHIKKWL